MQTENQPAYPIQWWQGMLLAPEHFQQNHIYWEQQRLGQLANLQPYYWGVSELKLNQSALQEGRIRIERLRAVMPDGLGIDYQAQLEPALELDLNQDKAFNDAGQALVHLAVPVRTESAASTSAPIQRFDSIDTGLVADENTGEKSVTIKRLKPRLELKATAQPESQFVALPLLKVKRGADGSFTLVRHFPPLLQAGGANFLEKASLSELLGRMLAGIRHKAIQLAGIAEKQGDQSGFGISIQQRHTIHCLAKELPRLEIMVTSQCAHPYDLYLALAGMVGQMADLKDRLVPPLLRPYDHLNPGPGFFEAIGYISKIADGINLSFTTVSFAREENGDFSLVLDQPWAAPTMTIELQGGPNQKPSQLTEWLEQCRIASSGVMKSLATHRHLGVARQVIQKDVELDIGPSPGGVLVRITNDPKLILKDQKLVVACTDETMKAGNSPRSVVLHWPHQQKNHG